MLHDSCKLFLQTAALQYHELAKILKRHRHALKNAEMENEGKCYVKQCSKMYIICMRSLTIIIQRKFIESDIFRNIKLQLQLNEAILAFEFVASSRHFYARLKSSKDSRLCKTYISKLGYIAIHF